ncbi:putative Peroxiredoxin Q, chloroplastic [Blattamonas nauphoetae]|uniref:thioredoxin-dependent peroxiredoxin n=1 Tax=Blattamonas nauphoetae TaxID=2049346 RepID=A0ABQ9WST3_9EUKA|nr:putative Peroxiredoxin Q, chloroplastic [Blattamonas nauphoetae]
MAARVGVIPADFELKDDQDATVRFSDMKGKGPFVIYFYPKDDTPGCTKEACSFRDSHEAFIKAGAVVYGVSSDSVKKHVEFKKQYRLPFSLLSDEGNKLRKLWEVPRGGLFPGRVTYVFDKEGKIHLMFEGVMKNTEHMEKALEMVQKLAAEMPAPADVAPSSEEAKEGGDENPKPSDEEPAPAPEQSE